MTPRFEPHLYAKFLKGTEGYAVEAGLLYHWNQTHWSPVQDEIAYRTAYCWLAQNDRNHVSADYAKKAVAAAKCWLPPLTNQTNDIVIPCANGYVHVEDNKLSLKPANKALGLKHVLTCDFTPDFGQAMLFESFLKSILPEHEVRERVQEYVGYTLMPDTRHQVTQLWLGSGANGKGVLANIVKKLHGHVAAVNLDALNGFKLSGIVGASLIFVDEVPRSRIQENIFKSLISGDDLQIDRKFEVPLTHRVTGKWLVLGNHLPVITDHSIGFWRRWDIVPFNITIAAEDRNPLLADDIIRNELPAVLNWALEGLLRLQKRGKFDPLQPAAMRNILADAKKESNSVQAWFDEADVTLSTTHMLAKDDVYQHYRDWCSVNGASCMSSLRFWKLLHGIATVVESRHRQGARLVRYCHLDIPNVPKKKIPR